MIRKDLPSASGLPDEWDRDMELRLGFLEAQDEARDPSTIIKVLKLEFPELSEIVISTESLARWIDWLDRQDGRRGDNYRAGLASGQVMVLKNLKAKGVELEPMDLNRYSKSDIASTPGPPTNDGIRLVENEDDVDEEVRAAARNMALIMNGTNSSTISLRTPTSPSMTTSYSQQSMPSIRIGITPIAQHITPVTYLSADPPGTYQDPNSQFIRDLQDASSWSPAISANIQPQSSSATSVSVYFPKSTAGSSLGSAPITPASTQHRSNSIAFKQSPRRSQSATSSPTIKRSATVGSTSDSQVRMLSGLEISDPISSSQGLRERRQLGQLNVGIIPHSQSIHALPDIRGMENHQVPGTPGGSSTRSARLRARLLGKWNRA